MIESSARPHRVLLPSDAPRFEGCDVAGGTSKVEEAGARSLWDWFTVDGGRPVMALIRAGNGETSPTSTLAATRGILRTLAPSMASLSDLMTAANASLCGQARPGFGHDVAVALLSVQGSSVAWSSAGDSKAGILRRAGTLDEMGTSGPPLGILPGFGYKEADFELGVGDQIVALSRPHVGLFRGAADMVVELGTKSGGEVVQEVHRALGMAADIPPEETSVIFVRKHTA